MDRWRWLAVCLLLVASCSVPTQPVSPYLVVQDGRLSLHGHPVQLTGVDAYGATTSYDVNYGCGAPVTGLDGMFAALPPGSLVRTWAFQALGWNDKQDPQHLDFSAIDRVVSAAERHHDLLDLALSDQAGTCDDGHWHDQAWYDGGYRVRHPDDGRGLGDLSYSDWVQAVVSRYASSTAVGIWEPVNEPEASDCTGAMGTGCTDPARKTCPPGAAASLRGFFDRIGSTIHALDPHALVGTGELGGGECGADGYASIAASPYVDVLSYHDYGADDTALPDGLAGRLSEAHAAGKPLLVGEAGIAAGPGCETVAARAALVAAKVRAARDAGAAGWLAWNYSERPAGCSDDVGPGDPMFTSFALKG